MEYKKLILNVTNKRTVIKDEKSQTQTDNYVLRAIGIEEIEEIEQFLLFNDLGILKKLDFIRKENIEIVAFGKSKEITKYLLDLVIPVYNKKFDKTLKKYLIEFKCYAKQKRDLNTNVVIHEDNLSSFKCALACLGNPTYSLITLEKCCQLE